MKFFNAKWNNSSILTKISAWIMAFATLLLLVTVFILLSWNSKLGGGLGGYAILYLIFFAIVGLIAFGLFKVNRIARVLMIWAGIFYLIGVILSFAVVGSVMKYAKEVTKQAAVEAVGKDAIKDAETAGKMASDAATSALAAQAASQVKASGITGIIVKAIIKAIPVNVLARIGFYIFVIFAPMYLTVLSGLFLIFCGKDFRRKNEETQPAVS